MTELGANCIQCNMIPIKWSSNSNVTGNQRLWFKVDHYHFSKLHLLTVCKSINNSIDNQVSNFNKFFHQHQVLAFSKFCHFDFNRLKESVHEKLLSRSDFGLYCILRGFMVNAQCLGITLSSRFAVERGLRW